MQEDMKANMRDSRKDDVPVFYRIDHLWGKTPEKAAQPGLKPDTFLERQEQEKKEKLQEVEDRARQTVERFGMDRVAKLPPVKGRGRPKGSKSKVKTSPCAWAEKAQSRCLGQRKAGLDGGDGCPASQ